MKFLCEHCKAKYQIADDKVAGRTVRMKCRKCGGSIEVRASITETSVAAKASELRPSDPPKAASTAPARTSGAPPRAPTPRTSPLATSLSQSSRAVAPPRTTSGSHAAAQGSLAGAFQRNVNRDDDPGAAGLDLRELSAADEWYVAVNGVPVGPVRVGEVRRKAAMGAVTEDSLCWQEGMEEWRAVRTVTELAAVVREAASGNRTSQIPAEPRAPSPPRPAPPRRPTPLAGSAHAKAPTAPRPVVAAAPQYQPMDAGEEDAATIVGRSPLLDMEPDEVPAPMNGGPQRSPIHASDPFKPAVAPFAAPFALPTVPTDFAPHAAAASPFGAPFAAPVMASAAPAPPIVVAPSRRMNPIAAGMIAMFACFGMMAAWLTLGPKRDPVPVASPAPVAQTPSAMAVPTDVAASTPGAPTSNVVTLADPVRVAGGTVPHAGGATGAAANPNAGKPAAAPIDPALRDLIGQGGTGPNTGPGGGGGGGGGGGAQLTEDQTRFVVTSHSVGVKRECWDHSSSTTASVNVTVDIVINNAGQVTSATATGNDPVVSHCLEEAIKRWKWPGAGEVKVPFHFLRQ